MPGITPWPVDALLPALAAVAIHSLAMLATTAAVAVLVYDWIGVGSAPAGLGQSRPAVDRSAGIRGRLATRLSRPRGGYR